MGLHFAPRNYKEGVFYAGTASFGWFLEQGAGMAIGYIRTVDHQWLIHDKHKRNARKSFFGGEHFWVSASEARQLGISAELVVGAQERIVALVDAMPVEDRDLIRCTRGSELPERLKPYRVIRPDFLEKLTRFSEWAPKSGGFTVA
jgi:hypothetical protein